MNEVPLILFIDYDAEFRAMMEKTLERMGYKVIHADSGTSAVKILSEVDFDAVISERSMPDMDGKELMRAIKSRNPELPVIFVTTKGEVESYMDLMNIGAFDYFDKPGDKGKIIATVERAIESRD